MKTYLFHRMMPNGKLGFYPVQYKSDDDAIEGAMHNPGTTMVTTVDGLVIYPKVGHKQ